MRVLKKGNRTTKRLAYTSLVRPILEYGLYAGIYADKDSKCVRQSTEESCSIYKSHEGFWLGNLGSA
jgi:hypothetical protein